MEVHGGTLVRLRIVNPQILKGLLLILRFAKEKLVLPFWAKFEASCIKKLNIDQD